MGAALNFAGKIGSFDPSETGGSLNVESVTHQRGGNAITIPDAHLLFTGDYKRAGLDLILSKDGHELVVPDYFRGEQRASLASPDGALLTADVVKALLGQVEYAQAAAAPDSAKVIGHVTKIVGNATAIRNGVSIILSAGDNVNKGDVVQSGSDSTLGITFIDGTVFGLSSNARMVLNEMVYDPNGSSNSSLLSLVAGTITFVAGETAKHGDMKVNTPVATMGIRGTAVLVEIDFTVPAQGGAPPVKFQVLVEPDGHTGSYLLYSLVNPNVVIGQVNAAGVVSAVTASGDVSTSAAPPLTPAAQAIIGQTFQAYFQGGPPDNTNPKSTSPPGSTPASPPPEGKPGDTSPIKLDTLPSGTPVVVPIPVKLPAPDNPNAINPVLTPIDVTITVLKTIDVTPVVDQPRFKIGDIVKINDSQPADVLVPYVPGTASIVSAAGPSDTPVGINLASLVAIDAQAGAVSYDPHSFSFLKLGEKVIVTIGFDSKAGTDTFHQAATLTIDSPAPTVTIATPGGATGQHTHTISGSVTAAAGEVVVGSTVTLVDTYNGVTTPLGSTATVRADGSWTANNVTLVGDGTHQVVAFDIDLAGNPGTSAPVVFTVDTVTPTAAVAVSSADVNLVHNTALVTFTFSQAPSDFNLGHTSAVGGTLGPLTASPDGKTYTATFTANAGTDIANASVSVDNTWHNADGNLGTGFTSPVFVVDTVTPTLTEHLVSDTGSSSADNITSNDGLTGIGLADTLVHFKVDGVDIASTTSTNAEGVWSFTPSGLMDGAHTIIASQTDGFGNTGTATLSFTLDTDAPVVTIGNINATTQTISGTADPADVGAPITILDSVTTNNPLTPYATALLTAGQNQTRGVLINGLGGPAGFGTNTLAAGDDNYSSAINITSVFGTAGVNFFGHNYTSLYINNNGNITFAQPNSTYTPSAISAQANNPIIAPFWADVDTRGGPGTPTGGNDTGANKVFYNLDSVDGVLTITWDDVGYYSQATNKLDAFQVQLISLGGGNFDIVYRYASINWTTGSASGGVNGLGGTPARAGYSAGDGNIAHYFELPQSGNQAELLALPTTPGDTGIAGVDVYQVLNGQVGTPTVTTIGSTTVNSDGTWSANVTLPNGPNTVTAQETDLAGNTGTSTPVILNGTNSAPAGVAGSTINLGLTQPAGVGSEAVTVTGSWFNWTMEGANHNPDGSWTALTSDFSMLTITPDVNFVGAAVLTVTESWINSDGSANSKIVSDNVEAYAPSSPIFAIAGDDHLTGTGNSDQFVFAQPIGNDVIYNFDPTTDRIDLIGFSGIATFGDLQGNIADDVNGNAVIHLGANETITLSGVHAADLTSNGFEFNQAPIMENPGTMQLGDRSKLPLSGTVQNSGTIELNSTGDETDLQLIGRGVAFTGAGHIVLSDSAQNIISGTSADVTMTNADNIVSGAGQIGNGKLVLTNGGTIDATGANSLTIDTGANVVINSGTLEATGSGGLTVQSDVINTGFLWANGGDTTFRGNVTGDGSALISGLASLEFGAGSSQNTAFAAGSSGTLVLDQASYFSGIISGMTSSNHLDLLDFSFAKGTTLNYSPNVDGSGGVLTVTDATHSANITLSGHFSPGGFQAGIDHGTGTLISYHDVLLV